ncbi:LysR family transcriptional regulator [Lysinibacillus xylanilyticus]|uniref:LysR family transcriptional regulator n=1 Tax=Lysinibacillus xylanilyticus TaxID=582475 RepID=UPI003D00FAEE
MDLKWVKTFITVYEEGSFRAAAEKLFISQPSITVHIKALEEELQVQLFKREHTKITMTEIGKQYYMMGKKLLAQVEEDKRTIKSFSNNKKIRIVMALSSSLTSANILKIVHNFMYANPQYEIEIRMQETNHLDDLLKNEQIDIVISLNRTKSKDLHSEQILSESAKLIYSSNTQLVGDTFDQQLKNLFDSYPLYIGYLDEHAPIMEWLGKEYRIKQFNHVKDSIFAVRLIKENIGIGILPEFQVASEIAEEQLKVLDIGAIASLYRINIYISYKRDQEHIQPFLIYLRNQFQ